MIKIDIGCPLKNIMLTGLLVTLDGVPPSPALTQYNQQRFFSRANDHLWSGIEFPLEFVFYCLLLILMIFARHLYKNDF